MAPQSPRHPPTGFPLRRHHPGLGVVVAVAVDFAAAVAELVRQVSREPPLLPKPGRGHCVRKLLAAASGTEK